MRVDDELWSEFNANCKAEGRYPRRVIEALLMEWANMTPARKAKMMARWAKWWGER